MEDEKPLQRVGDYEFLDRLAVGGMGQLWRVRHVKLGAIYVAKVLRPELRDDPEFATRFLHEARLVANLRHPNVVQVFGYDEEHMLYLMEYVEGMDLDRLMRRRKTLEFSEKRVIIEVVADAIGYAHRHFDLIHRDIKPSNVLIAILNPDDPIQPSHIKLTDFGIAKVLSLDQRITISSGMVMGTVHYMAPEQFEGNAAKPSDVYSIGVLYYQLLTGKLPFDGPTAFVVRDKHLHEVPPEPHSVNPDIPIEDSDIVMRCLEKEAENRFQDGAELFAALTATRSATRPTARTMTLPHVRATPSGPAEATEATEPLEPTERIQRPTKPTTRTVTGATERAPEAPTEPAGPPTTPTVVVRRSRLSRAARWTLPTLAALAVLGLLASQLLRPRYEIRWSTLRSDPRDTPNGIHVAVCPRIGFRLFWWPVGVIGDTAPPNWANWTTWFSTIDVKLSDGLYRAYVLRCRRPEGASFVDFGGATFEQLAAARQATVVEDPARIGDYINAVLVPRNLASARSLAGVRRALAHVAGLVSKAQGIEVDRTRLDAYQAILKNLTAAAETLADGYCDKAEESLREAEAALRQLPGTASAAPSSDFLFRQTLRNAIAQVKERADKAGRALDRLELPTDTAGSTQYTLDKYRTAGTLVAGYLMLAPGRNAYLQVEKKAKEGGDAESLLKGLGEEVTPAIAMAQRYLAKLDALLDHTPADGQEGLFRAGVLKLLDEAAASSRPARASWLESAFAEEDLGFLDFAQKLWREAHRRRVGDAARRCRKLASDRMAKALALPLTQEDAPAAARLFEGAQACLEALRAVASVPEEDRKGAAGLLGACSVRHALALFCIGSQTPEQEGEHLDAVRKLLDHALDELPSAATEVREEANALKQVLKATGVARRKLAACVRENFATPGACGGTVGTLFDALRAFQTLAQDLGKHADQPCGRAALDPFTHLRAESCRGFTLPNAAAWWLLANANQCVLKGSYGEACRSLLGFQTSEVAKTSEVLSRPADSPLKSLLPPAIPAKAAELLKLAACFDEASVPTQGVAPKERWKKLWDARLERGKPLLAIELPQTLPPQETVPQAAGGQEKQWEALFAEMRKLLDHYRDRILAEEDLRRLEGELEKLVLRAPDAVRANPATASTEAIARCSDLFKQFKARGLAPSPLGEKVPVPLSDDHPARLARVQSDLAALQTGVVGLAERVAGLLTRGDPKAALDELRDNGGALGKAAELDLTQRAMKALMAAATEDISQKNFATAAVKLAALQQHEQVRRQGGEPAIKAALDEAAKPLLYCEAQGLLARGASEFAAALPKLRQAGPFRDAEAVAKQIGRFQEAAAAREADPFKAADGFLQLLSDKDLNPKVKDAAEKASGEIRQTLLAGASACVKSFNGALVRGGWEDLLDRTALPEERLEQIRTFLQQAQALEVADADGPGKAEFLADGKQIRLKSRRTLKFIYKLPDDATMPVTLEQSIEWTLRYAPPEGRKERPWLISDWWETR